MLRYAVIAVLTFSVILANESNEYVSYNFKLPKITADLLLKMKDKLKHKTVEMTRDMEKECRYLKAMEQYGFSIEMALLASNGACTVDSDITTLQKCNKLYKSSLIECFEEMTSAATYESTIDEVVNEIQTIDKEAKSQVDACSGDTDCEKLTFQTTHANLTSLYQSRIAELKVAEDKALTASLTFIRECMVPKVADSLKEIYVAIEKLISCTAEGADARASGKQEAT